MKNSYIWIKIYPIGSEENNTESKRDTSASPTKLRRRRRSKSTEKTRENGTASSDKFRLDQSGSSSSESEDEGSMSEDEYSYSCVVYNKGDQEDSENMDPVSTYLFESLLNVWSIKIRTIHKLSLWLYYDFFWQILISYCKFLMPRPLK